MYKIKKLLRSTDNEDFVLGLHLAVKNCSKKQFKRYCVELDSSGERLFCFKAYGIIWKAVKQTDNTVGVFIDRQDLETAIMIGYKYIEL